MSNRILLADKYNSIFPYLDEKQRRLVAAGDALVLGRGGISEVSKTSGMSRPTIYQGIKDLQQREKDDNRIRKVGGGRKKLSQKKPSILNRLESLVEPLTRGDPMSHLRWTCKSTRQLAEELSQNNYPVSHTVVAEMLHELGYSLQANFKSIDSSTHTDRDKQFRYINSLVETHIGKGLPVISVDTKKKELVGQYKNNGKEWRPKGKPENVNTHDFLDKKLGKAIPYGVYDIGNNLGWVNVGCDSDTAAFAVESIRRWWLSMGRSIYEKSGRLLITADSGGSNGYRIRLWKVELQKLANEIEMDITVCHFPPGTSKWNKIEHRLFSYISMNWRGQPLVSHEVIVNLIGSTTTKKGLRVTANLDKNRYPKGIKVSDDEFARVQLEPHEFHGEWNYTIKTRQKGCTFDITSETWENRSRFICNITLAYGQGIYDNVPPIRGNKFAEFIVTDK